MAYRAAMRFLLLPLLGTASQLAAAPPDVLGIDAVPGGGGWRFAVTLRHPDSGWDHYADGWRIETEDGTVLGTRELLHPHVAEQPFTRALSGVAVPEGMAQVFVRAKCSAEGWSPDRTPFILP